MRNQMFRRSAVTFFLIAAFAIVEIYMLYRHCLLYTSDAADE